YMTWRIESAFSTRRFTLAVVASSSYLNLNLSSFEVIRTSQTKFSSLKILAAQAVKGGFKSWEHLLAMMSMTVRHNSDHLITVGSIIGLILTIRVTLTYGAIITSITCEKY